MKFEELLPQYTVPLKEKEIVKGRIVKILKNVVLVDLGLKSEGELSIDEFSDPNELKEGNEIYVYLEKLEDREGKPVISKKQADFILCWDKIKEKYEKGEAVEMKVKKKVKGGLIVEVFGLPAFLPGSQIDIKPVPNHDALIGQVLKGKIIQVNYSKQNIVVSRRELLEEEIQKKREALLKKVKVGDVVTARVKSLTDFGAFVEIEGVDALLHVSDISWNKVVHPSEVLSIDQEIKVKILAIDEKSYRITVGMKQLQPHPWDVIEEKYPVGSRVKGKVTSLAEYGAFVELEKGVEGLIHVSEMSWTRTIHHPSQILKVGQEVEAVVLHVDKENRRISLGLKQTMPDPWSMVDEKFKVGEKVIAKIRSYKEFGAFVELEEGIEGLIPTSEISWTKKIRHPKEVFKKGQKVEAVITEIDKINRQITLSVKRLKEDPLEIFAQEYKVGDNLKVRIIDIPKAGLVVSLPYGLEGFIPNSLVARDEKGKRKEHKIGEEIEVKISEIDKEKRRIVLNERAVQKELIKVEAEQAAEDSIKGFKSKEKKRKYTIGEKIKREKKENE
ncbi:MAG: 30S ribosomal protein S1 [candidate division WOR-3 bacterium]|nr:30S ribosomal protein S1 [candidate division WOR-3 bacterium]MDW8113327.1 30S ribosomal protein S1 [candidate division WOR-3 bacterium]